MQTCVWQYPTQTKFCNDRKKRGIGVKECVLYDRECIECGECDRCDLDPNKICDNCMKCVNGDREYRSILIDEVRVDQKKGKDAHS